MVYLDLFTCMFSDSICTVSIGQSMGAMLGWKNKQEPSSPTPPHTQKCFLQLLFKPRCRGKSGDGGQGPLCRGLHVLEKGVFHRDLPPCPSQALCNLAVGKAGLTALWFCVNCAVQTEPEDRLLARSIGAVLAVNLASPVVQRTYRSASPPLQLNKGAPLFHKYPTVFQLQSLAVLPFCWRRGHPCVISIQTLHKMLFQRDSLDLWALRASPAVWLPSPGCAPHHPISRGPSEVTPARLWTAGNGTGSRVCHSKKPVCWPAAMSPAAFCLLLLWETLHLRAWQSSPKLALVTCREDSDDKSPAAWTAQVSRLCSNAMDFA